LDRHGLIISHYFPPQGGGGVQRWVKFIKYLSQLDWKFSVITAPIIASLPLDHSLQKDLPQNVNVYRVPDIRDISFFSKISDRIPRGYIQRWTSSFFNITDSRSVWNEHVRLKIESVLNSRRIDLLVFSIPPYSLAQLAAFYARSQSVPVLLDFRDPWTLNPYKIYPTVFHRMIDRYREKKSVSDISLISSAYRSVLTDFSNRIPDFSDKYSVHIPNGYDEDDFKDLVKDKPGTDNVFRIGFSGSFYSHLNQPQPLFHAIKRLKTKGYLVELHHFGNSVYDVERIARQIGIADAYTFHGYKEHREALTQLMQMDANCIILDQRQNNADKTVGGKFYEYLRMGKPILAIVPGTGEAAEIIKQTESGLICNREPEMIAGAIESLLNQTVKFSFRKIKQYSRKELTVRLNEFLEKHIQ
jgi:hypothetical protein